LPSRQPRLSYVDLPLQQSCRFLLWRYRASRPAARPERHTISSPHRAEIFKLSTDPLLVEKVRDIVGLYLAPPERAVALCVDEKSQIQALD
jgi:hypothetical protein